MTFAISGKLDGAGAWELRTRIEGERPGALTIDFSQVSEFADYAVAVLSQAFTDKPHLIVTGLRQHTLRVFQYFGLDYDALSASFDAFFMSRLPATAAPAPDPRRA